MSTPAEDAKAITDDERVAEAIERIVADAPPIPADAAALLRAAGCPAAKRAAS